MKKNKKIFAILAATLCVILAVTLFYRSYDSSSNKNSSNDISENQNSELIFELSIDGKSYEIASVNDDSITNIVIPSTYLDLPVVSIQDSAFSNCNKLTNIVIPSSVTSIGSGAFSGCSSLETISLPFIGASKDATGSNALFGYIFGASSYIGGVSTNQYDGSSYIKYYIPNSLKEVIVLEGCTSIESYAFYECGSIANIVIPKSVTLIGHYAFSKCKSLTSIIFEDNSQLECIEYFAFNSCSKLNSIIIPRSVTSIGSDVFYNCSSLETITLPFIGETKDSNTYLGYIFGATSYSYNSNYVPSSLKKVTIFEGCTSVEDYAFYECGSIANIVIPKSVTSIGAFAFSNCTSLTSVEFEDNSELESIGDSAFSSCNSLTSIVIPSSVTSIGSRAFSNCSSLTIYCEADSQPSGWDSDWNSSNCLVVWGYKG